MYIPRDTTAILLLAPPRQPLSNLKQNREFSLVKARSMMGYVLAKMPSSSTELHTLRY